MRAVTSNGVKWISRYVVLTKDVLMFAKLHTGKVIAEVRASAPLPEFKSKCSAVATTPFVLDVQYA